MATIVKRGNSYAVVYGYIATDGERKQRWETFYSEKEAIDRKMDIENPNDFVGMNPKIRTLNDLMDYYIDVRSQTHWSMSTYSNNTGRIKNYIRPYIGTVELRHLNAHFLSRYFHKLASSARVENKYKPKDNGLIGRSTLEEIYKLLRSILQEAVHWGLMNENPISNITLPRFHRAVQSMLNTQQIALLITESMQNEDFTLALLIQFAFICSMRKGEILGLCWSGINLDEGYLQISQELTRENIAALETLKYKDVYHVFDPIIATANSRLVLKTPKTYSSNRTIYLPQTFIQYLRLWKERQQHQKDELGKEYEDYNLVFANKNGRPFCPRKATCLFVTAVQNAGFPKVSFHSLRYSSTSYKLILSNGDIKAVQGDTGHAQPNMVLSVYAQIQDERRKSLANMVAEDFYQNIGSI